jgi:heat shock protein HspQ
MPPSPLLLRQQPERSLDPETVVQDVQAAYARGKTYYIVVAEGVRKNRMKPVYKLVNTKLV